MSQQPYYRLKQLIIDKYGAENFVHGLQMVAQWLSFDVGIKITTHDVVVACNESSNVLSKEAANSLATLFGFKHNPKQLLTNSKK